MLIYTLLIYLYILLIRIASIWNEKALLWIKGRKDWHLKLSQSMTASGGKKVVWLHCASLGEFEQGRPLMESIKKEFPEVFLVLTFFSPSGFEIRKNYDVADLVLYLPADTPHNAKKFLDLLQPSIAIFVKYEYWFNLLNEIERRKIPTLMVSGIFFKDQFFFRWYGKWGKRFLHVFDMIFVQDFQSEQLLRENGILHMILAGDTRFDRVLSIAENFNPIEPISDFCGDRFTYVLGSTWEEDEELWQHWIASHPEEIFIIAPHEISEEHVAEIEKRWQGCIRFSNIREHQKSSSTHVLIIDNIGMLSRIYFYADIAYIGGGFGDGIHNTLEAAVFGKPVIFGPNHEIFTEAKELILEKAGFVVHNAKELESCLTELNVDAEKMDRSSQAAAKYVASHAGATQKIITYIQENLRFKS